MMIANHLETKQMTIINLYKSNVNKMNHSYKIHVNKMNHSYKIHVNMFPHN